MKLGRYIAGLLIGLGGLGVFSVFSPKSEPGRSTASIDQPAPAPSPIMVPVPVVNDGIDSVPAVNFRITKVKEQLQGETKALEKRVDGMEISMRDGFKDQKEETRLLRAAVDEQNRDIKELLRRTPKRTERAEMINLKNEKHL